MRWLFLILICVGCDDGSPASAEDPFEASLPDTSLPDTSLPDTSLPDASLPDASLPDASPPDASLPDAAAPDAAPPFETIALTLEALQGSTVNPTADGVILDPGDWLEWALPPLNRPFAVAVDATQWRVEDGALTVQVGDTSRPAQRLGDGDRGLVPLRAPLDGPQATGYGAAHRPPIIEWNGATLRLEARGGTLLVHGAALVDPRYRRPPLAPIPPPAGGVQVPVEAGDLGARVTQLVAEAPDGPVVIRLAPGTHRLQTPIIVRRDAVWIVGDGPQTELVWDPASAGVSDAAILFVGPGLGAVAPIPTAVESGQRHFVVDAPEDWAPRWVRIAADDFGPIPRACINGRDVERYQRHQTQLAEVLAIERSPEGARVTLDRPINEALPLAANPRLIEARLLIGGGVRDLRLVGACPEAFEVEGFEAPDCSNAAVVGDNGIHLRWTDGATVQGVQTAAFGKFAVLINEALRSRVTDYTMSHPAAYGGGGQGYGVHFVRASRSITRRVEVFQARHGVVVDFGSSDSQVLDGQFHDMSEAQIDVHGEACRDTLIMNNTIRGSNMSVIVGGGGLETHCNDGPRHHLIGNTMTDASLAALVVFKESFDVFARYNTFENNRVDLSVAFGAGRVSLRRNLIAGTTGRVVLAVPPVPGLSIVDNRFEDACSLDAVVAELPGIDLRFEDNQLCPE